jgi:hypothetical protein
MGSSQLASNWIWLAKWIARTPNQTRCGGTPPSNSGRAPVGITESRGAVADSALGVLPDANANANADGHANAGAAVDAAPGHPQANSAAHAGAPASCASSGEFMRSAR